MRGMRLILTVMVRDEVDIIAAMVEHHMAQGVDLIIATDNGSIDGTTEILQAYADVGAVDLHHDPVHRKHQHSVVTGMARRARTEYAADWVINADADEFWVPRDRNLTLRDALEHTPLHLNAFTVPVVNMVGPPALRGSFIDRLLWRDCRTVECLRSVGLHAHPTDNAVHRGDPGIVIAQGNHFVSLRSNGRPAGPYQIEVLHFPWRSWDQFRRKVVNAGLAYESNPDLRPSKNHHGRADYDRYKADRLFEAFMLRQPAADEIETAEVEGALVKDTWFAGYVRELVEKALRPDLLLAALDCSADESLAPAEHHEAADIGRKFILLERERDDALRSAEERSHLARRLAVERDAAREKLKTVAQEKRAAIRQRKAVLVRAKNAEAELQILKKQSQALAGKGRRRGPVRGMKRAYRRVRRRIRRHLGSASARVGKGAGGDTPRHPSKTLTTSDGAKTPRSLQPQRSRKAQHEPPAARSPADMLARSPLFDASWYAEQCGKPLSRSAAARHYLRRGQAAGFTPHPLFDPQHFAENRAEEFSGVDPFVAYISSAKHLSEDTHPLFDVASYLASYPQALEHPGGPLAHYVDVGAPSGARPNDWYEPDIENQPNGLVGWLYEALREWRQRQQAVVPPFTNSWPESEGRLLLDAYRGDPDRAEVHAPLVSVILSTGQVGQRFQELVDALAAQTLTDWELIVVVDQGAPVPPLSATMAADSRVHVLREAGRGTARSWNLGLAIARGSYVAWMDGEATWNPDHLRLAVYILRCESADITYDLVEQVVQRNGEWKRRYSAAAITAERLQAGAKLNINSIVAARDIANEVEGFDESLPESADYDFILKLAKAGQLSFVPYRGVTLLPKRPRGNKHHLIRAGAWEQNILNRHLVDWRDMEQRPREADSVSVIIPTVNDWRLTETAVRSVARAAEGKDGVVEVIVVDNGSKPNIAAVLASLRLRLPNVSVIHSPINRGFALGNNIALPHAAGESVVFLNNDTEVSLGWLDPLTDALRDPEILGAQSLLIYPTGAIQSAGVAFPSCGGIPHALLQGFPVEDADGLENATFTALTGAALAMRMQDVIAMRGFDGLYLNGMEDVDLGLRMRQSRKGRFTVRPDSVVVHHESRSAGRFTHSLSNRRLLLDRWRGTLPGDDVKLWGGQGFEVVGYSTPSRATEDPRVSVPTPTLARAGHMQVVERPRRMRWALKNPAPAGPESEKWGDTHFARRLATALRSLGQEVVIDHRPEFERPSGRFDDVVLVLRGLAPYWPVYGQLSFAWVISHPEMLRRPELASYDRVFAASVKWSNEMSQLWDIRIDPLLQATDPALFHPDLARPDTGYPVLFVGGSRQKLRPIVRDAIDAGMPLSVFGSEWEGLVPDDFIVGQYLPNEELGAAYRAAGMVLNDHWDDMRHQGFLSNRLFDAAASGARIITDDVSGLREVFGSSVQVVQGSGELRRVFMTDDLDTIFGDDSERRAMAAHIGREHSFEARAQVLIDAAMESYSEVSAVRRDAMQAPE